MRSTGQIPSAASCPFFVFVLIAVAPMSRDHGMFLAGDECELFDVHDTGDCPKVTRKLADNSTLKTFVKQREFCKFAHAL